MRVGRKKRKLSNRSRRLVSAGQRPPRRPPLGDSTAAAGKGGQPPRFSHARHGDRLPWLVVTLALLACIAFPFSSVLQLDRASALVEPWRVVTSQWTHWSGEHLLWDVAVFIALGVGCERHSRRAMAVAIGLAAWIVPVAVLVGCPSIDRFRGLSGIDCALFGLLLATAYREAVGGARAIVLLVGVGFFAKTAYEAASGRTLFVASAGQFAVVPLAHAVGFAIGAAVGASGPRAKQRSSTTVPPIRCSATMRSRLSPEASAYQTPSG